MILYNYNNTRYFTLVNLIHKNIEMYVLVLLYYIDKYRL